MNPKSGSTFGSDALALRVGIGLAAFLAVMVGGAHGTQDAVANGDTRTLSLYNNNTKESLSVTFRRNGQYDSGGLQQLNWFLRDWRRDEPTRMDPRLFDTVWEVYRESGSNEPIRVNSGYRSPNTNSMLRRRSSAVAKNSQHMQGKAMDFYLPDVSTVAPARHRHADPERRRRLLPQRIHALRASRRRQRPRLAAHDPRPARQHLPGRQDRPYPVRRPPSAGL